LYPPGVREGVDTNFTLTGSPQAATLRGQVRLNELSFSPSFDLADFAGQLSGTSSTPPQGFARNVQLDITVQSTNDLNLNSSKLSLQGAANLRVRGNAAEPVLLGRVNLTGGDLIFRGSRYFLQPSTIEFTNPYRIEPRLNLGVDTTVQQYNIHMLFRGTMDQLRTTYSSDPALPPSDIINLLVFGKTTEAAAANPTPGNLGAQSMIASSISSQLTSRIEKIAGISQLSIDPVLGGGGGLDNARVTVQQRVTGNLFVTFAADATSTQRQVIKLEYQATPRVSLSGVRDQNGGLAVDVKIKKTW
jgi:translocation and assembly module TamB